MEAVDGDRDRCDGSDSPQGVGAADARDGKVKGRSAHRDLQPPGQVVHLMEGRDQSFLFLAMNLLEGPAEMLEVLDPLEVADDDAPRVGQDIGHDGNAALAEDLVGLGPGRAVGGLDDQLGLDGLGLLPVEDSSQRRGNQDVDRQRQELVVGRGFSPLESDHLARHRDVPVKLGDVQPRRVHDASVGVGDGDDLGPLPPEVARRVAAHVAVALDREGRARDRPVEPRHDLAGDDGNPVSRGRFAAFGTMKLHRLAGHARRVEPLELAVFVHDPGHDLGICSHVGSGNVLDRPDHVVDLLDEPPGQPLELAARELGGIAVDAPLGSAVRAGRPARFSRSSGWPAIGPRPDRPGDDSAGPPCRDRARRHAGPDSR